MEVRKKVGQELQTKGKARGQTNVEGQMKQDNRGRMDGRRTKSGRTGS